MIPRRCRSELIGLLSRHAGAVLLGPRQVGKTTLASDLAKDMPSTYLDLERPSDAARLADAELYLSRINDRLVILDEVQRMPGLFSTLRGDIDRRRLAGERTGQYLLLGSASNVLLNQSAESLAGRVVYLELAGFDVLEVGVEHSDRLWLRGGFPDAFDAIDDASSLEWRLAFIRTYLERDIPSLGARIPAETLRRLWTMLAHAQGGVLNASRLAAGLGVSGQTVGRYIDMLVDLMLVRRLEPWVSNVGKRLTRSPKIYVRDSGIVHALLGIQRHDDLLGHPVAGPSWEGFAIENLISALPRGATRWFYRTSAGAEIDLVVTLPDGTTQWAIEVKRALAPKASRGFRTACDDIGAARRIIVTPGTDAWPLHAEIEVIGLAGAMSELVALSAP